MRTITYRGIQWEVYHDKGVIWAIKVCGIDVTDHLVGETLDALEEALRG